MLNNTLLYMKIGNVRVRKSKHSRKNQVSFMDGPLFDFPCAMYLVTVKNRYKCKIFRCKMLVGRNYLCCTNSDKCRNIL